MNEQLIAKRIIRIEEFGRTLVGGLSFILKKKTMNEIKQKEMEIEEKKTRIETYF